MVFYVSMCNLAIAILGLSALSVIYPNWKQYPYFLGKEPKLHSVLQDESLTNHKDMIKKLDLLILSLNTGQIEQIR